MTFTGRLSTNPITGKPAIAIQRSDLQRRVAEINEQIERLQMEEQQLDRVLSEQNTPTVYL